jgi:hypothetical protein
MNKENVIEKLRDDNNYYGDFGKKYLSNSDISALLTNPLALGKPSEPRPAFLVGGYFHTAILEPDKLKKYRVIPLKFTKRCLVVNYACYNTRLMR